MDLEMLKRTASDNRSRGNQVCRRGIRPREDEAASAEDGFGSKRGAQANAAKIKAKGGKYSTKRRAWNSMSPKSRETSRANPVRASIFRPVSPSARIPLAKAISAGSELSKS